METTLTDNELYLGKNIEYKKTYAPELLRRIDRTAKRIANGISDIEFPGIDIWNHYEISYLNLQGIPQSIIGILQYSSNSKYMVESKSLKMYFNSFNQEKISLIDLQHRVISDLTKLLETPVKIIFRDIDVSWLTGSAYQRNLHNLINLDYITELDNIQYELLDAPLERDEADEPVYFVTNSFKSNCQVTHQPDFATCSIYMDSKEIPSPKSLFRYLISFRNHNEFHEDAADRIYYKLMKEFNPEKMYVLLQYSRRGGIDINPLRVKNIVPESVKLNRISRQ
jgi:7-cyano-7-deazaguanine reductase